MRSIFALDICNMPAPLFAGVPAMMQNLPVMKHVGGQGRARSPYFPGHYRKVGGPRPRLFAVVGTTPPIRSRIGQSQALCPLLHCKKGDRDEPKLAGSRNEAGPTHNSTGVQTVCSCGLFSRVHFGKRMVSPRNVVSSPFRKRGRCSYANAARSRCWRALGPHRTRPSTFIGFSLRSRYIHSASK
jgi:hypothetical protein